MARGTRAGFLIVSSEHRSWYCGSILVSVTTCGSTIHALRVGATLFEPRFCFFLQNALELFPFSPPSIQTTGSARARRRYHTGFAGKSAALMPVVRRQALYKGGRGHRCPFKRRESEWTNVSTLSCSPGDLRSPLGLKAYLFSDLQCSESTHSAHGDPGSPIHPAHRWSAHVMRQQRSVPRRIPRVGAAQSRPPGPVWPSGSKAHFR